MFSILSLFDSFYRNLNCLKFKEGRLYSSPTNTTVEDSHQIFAVYFEYKVLFGRVFPMWFEVVVNIGVQPHKKEKVFCSGWATIKGKRKLVNVMNFPKGV